MTLPVLGELRKVLMETRHPDGREAVATYSQVAGNFGKGENVVRKFERGETFPRYTHLDAFVAAYADATGTPPLDLWQKAIDRAVEAEKKLKRGVGPTAAEAAARPLRKNPAPKQKRHPKS